MPLSVGEMKDWMKKHYPDRLVIAPLVSFPSQVPEAGASIDVRLGHEFMIADRSALPYIDPESTELAQVVQYLNRVHVPLGAQFALHPRQFALGVTLEYLRLPLGLTAQVLGRSSWARVGLIIAMASFVHPGYAGCLTLELQNLGDVPIVLAPGYPVAQIFFAECVSPPSEQDPGQLTCAIGPEARDLISDDERPRFTEFRCLYKGSSGA